VVKAELGTKRTCPSCASRFYDLLRNPIVCPKCGVTFIAATLLPSKSDMPPRETVEELYLLAYGRLPTDEEREFGESLFHEPGASRRSAVEDLLWALLNSAEFVFKD